MYQRDRYIAALAVINVNSFKPPTRSLAISVGDVTLYVIALAIYIFAFKLQHC